MIRASLLRRAKVADLHLAVGSVQNAEDFLLYF